MRVQEFITETLDEATRVSQLFAPRPQIEEIYFQISVLNGIGAAIQDSGFDDGARILAKECQADLLSSLHSITFGFKRQSLVLLRCALEDMVFFLFFLDHPHEFKLWERKSYQPKVKETISKLRQYNVIILSGDLNWWLDHLTQLYETLSSAVHPTAGQLTSDLHERIQLQVDDLDSLRNWAELAKGLTRSAIALLYARFYWVFEGGRHIALKDHIRTAITVPERERLELAGFTI